ncbi:S-type pyocin domain-containing protein [Pseudomonas vancouverensis]|uniref:S-type pyocin domain-containing protein n=1 Tax=Pseudomonas vancouverensis TaxID=95300 RepID=UPI003D034320
MAQRTLGDGSTGDVIIRSGPPAAGGGGWGGGGFGGNRVGASGNFGGPSAKTVALRKRANQERQAAEARKQAEEAAYAAQAQDLARTQARQQVLESWLPRFQGVKAAIEQRYVTRTAQLESALNSEIREANRPAGDVPQERLQLYLINKEKSAIDGLIARKTAEIHANNAVAHSFDGQDAFSRSAGDYLARLNQFGDAFGTGHQIWESAYTAAHEVRLLSAQINTLRDKSNALITEHARWVKILAEWESQRQYAELRDVRVRYKQLADADTRIGQVRQANTVRFPVTPSMSAMSALAIQNGAWVAGGADALVAAVTRSVILLGEVAATLAVSKVAVFLGGMAYPAELGNGELTPEQRARLFHAVAIPANALELYDNRELQAIADTGGSIEVEYRLKPLAQEQGIAVVAVSTGVDIDARVPVVNAVLEPLTGIYMAEVPGSPTRYVEFTPEQAIQAQVPDAQPLAVTQPQLLDIPLDVDWRIQDCIVCMPGLEPVYLSFSTPPMGTGVVTGTGQPVTADWWSNTNGAKGAVIPVQVGDQLRGKELKSFADFDRDLWRIVGETPVLSSQFEGLNRKRIEQGFPPFAPKHTWVGENRLFELRYQERPEFWSDPFDIDKISIKAPSSPEGWIGIAPVVQPWPMPPASSWKPLVPPGSEHLGSTTTPATPTDPLVYPGEPAIPVLPTDETFPAVDEGEMGAKIPGFPGDEDLPSPDALFRDRRDDPGVATGVGQEVSGKWLGEATRGNGAPIPKQIADQLRGKEFANFHRFRESFWRTVAVDEQLRQQFSGKNLSRMLEGMSPYSVLADQVGRRKVFELHHDIEVSGGGDVYGIENISVMTPRRHIQLHKDRWNHEI